MHERETKITTIEDLTRMLFDARALMSLDVFSFQTFLYFCAVLSWSLAIGAMFPPGALIVRYEMFSRQTLMDVPVYDPSYRANSAQPARESPFKTNELGHYMQLRCLSPL